MTLSYYLHLTLRLRPSVSFEDLRICTKLRPVTLLSALLR